MPVLFRLRVFISVVFPLIVAAVSALAQDQPPKQPAPRPALDGDFDIRQGVAGEPGWQALLEQRKTAVESFRAAGAAAEIQFSLNEFGLPKTLLAPGAALTLPSQAGSEQIARTFLSTTIPFASIASGPNVLPLKSADITPDLRVLYFNQSFNGVEVFQGEVKVILDGAGRILQVNAGNLLPQFTPAAARLSIQEAIGKALEYAGAPPEDDLTETPAAGNRRIFHRAGRPATDEIAAELTIFPMTPLTARLAYRIFLHVDAARWFETLVDAEDGRLLFRHNLYRQAGRGRVWRETPQKGPRELVTFPDSWLAATSQVTTGNNVDAYVDANGDDRPDTTPASGLLNGRANSPFQEFDFPAGEGSSGQNPRDFKAAAVTNLFYLVNVAHDYFYGLGFTEAAGNFQMDNFGRGGLGNDPVLAEAHDGVDNASFGTPPDGIRPQMEMGIFRRGTNALTDDLDASYDGHVVIHEYGHGVSNRLVGGPSNVTCLRGVQSRAMGEGWSDYFSISFYNNPVAGSYVSQNQTIGLRRQSYETYTFTYEDLGNEGFEVHDDGEIWAAALWDLRKALGQAVTDKLVVDALKLTPCNPSMLDARDAILMADQATNGGANRAAIWLVFARHGMGFSAAGIDGQYLTGGIAYSALFSAAFDRPPDLQPGNRNPSVTSRPAGPARAGQAYTYDIVAADADSDPLQFELTQAPSGMTISSTGRIQWAPQVLSVRVKVTITDGRGGRVIHGFLLTVDTPLTPGTPLVVSAPRGESVLTNVQVPPNTPVLQATLRSGSGDSDLFLFDPTGRLVSAGDRIGTIETGSASLPVAGRWTIAVRAFQAFSNVSVAADFLVPRTVPGNHTESNLSGIISSETYFKVAVPADATSLRITTSGGTGDLDLFLKYGQPATCQTFDVSFSCSVTVDRFSAEIGNTESVNVGNPRAGDWYFTLSAARAYSGVTLNVAVSRPSRLLLGSNSLVFNFAAGSPAPAPQSFTIANANSDAPIFNWTAAATTASGGNWLRLGSTAGAQAATVAVSVDPTGLAPGTYRGTITVTAATLPDSPQTIAVTLNVTGGPRFAQNGVVNGASFQEGISPGSWFSIQGSNLSATAREWRASDFTGNKLPTSLDGVSVKVNGKNALIAYVSDGQINALAPDDDTTGNVSVIVSTPAGTGTTSTRLARYSPAFFLFSPSNRRYLAAVHADGTYLGAPNLFGAVVTTRPARPGDRILLFGTGFGPTSPPVPADDIFIGAAPLAGLSQFRLRIGGVPATVEFAGLIGNGLFQFNVVVPDVPGGDQLVSAEIAGAGTQANVFITVAAGSAPQIVAAPASLAFSFTPGGPPPAPQRITVTGGAGPAAFQVIASTTSGGSWLSVSPTEGVTPGVVTVAVDAEALAPGAYAGAVQILPSGAAGGPLTVPVSLTVGSTGNTIAIGQTINGTLTSTAPRSVGRPCCFADTYQFSVAATQTLTITMSSQVMDSYLQVLDASGTVIASDDDSGGVLNARIVRSFAPGTYRIEATTAANDQTGAYTLRLE